MPHGPGDVVEGLKLEVAAGGGLAERSKETQKREKKNPEKYSGRNIHTGRNTLKSTETAETHRNTPKFYPRWNGGLSRTGLHTGTRFSVHFGRNGMEYTTMGKSRKAQTKPNYILKL